MKIAYLSDFFPFSGFNSKFNTELVLSLSENNEVLPLTYYPETHPNKKIQKFKERSTIIDTKNLVAEKIIDIGNPLGYKSASKKITDKSPDLFITKFTSVSQNYIIGKLVNNLKQEKIPSICIFDVDITKINKFFSMIFFRYYISRFDVIFVASNNIAKYLEKYDLNTRIENFDYPLFDNFGYETEKISAKSKLGFSELSKTILYPVPFYQIPEYEIFIEILNKVPEDMRFIIIIENEDVFSKFEKKISESGKSYKVRLEFHSIFNSEVSLFFDASDAALLIFQNSYNVGLLSLCYNFNLPVISENHLSGSHIIDLINGGIVTSKDSPESVISQISGFFNTYASANYILNIQNAKNIYTWNELADKILRISKEIIV